MNKKLLERIQELFFHSLDLKTGHGKNEIKDIYKDAVNKALMEMVDNQQNLLKTLNAEKG